MLEPCLPRVLNTNCEAFDTVEVQDDTDIDDKQCTTITWCLILIVLINYFRIFMTNFNFYFLTNLFRNIHIVVTLRRIFDGWVTINIELLRLHD